MRATDIKHEASPQTWGSGGDDAFMVALMAVSWAGQASGGGGGGEAAGGGTGGGEGRGGGGGG